MAVLAFVRLKRKG